jgi:hypothetical protein
MKLLAQLSFSVLCFAAAACASTPAPSAQSPNQGNPTVPVATAPAASAESIFRLAAGELPGSNGHRWGSRSYEIRRTASLVELRLHDVTRFQGSGMSPHQMPAASHQCSAWEPLSAAASELVSQRLGSADGGEFECQSHAEVCATLVQFLKDSAVVPPSTATTPKPASDASSDMPMMPPERQAPTYGRGLGGC